MKRFLLPLLLCASAFADKEAGIKIVPRVVPSAPFAYDRTNWSTQICEIWVLRPSDRDPMAFTSLVAMAFYVQQTDIKNFSVERLAIADSGCGAVNLK